MKTKYLGYLLIGLIVLYAIAKMIGVVQYYENSTPAMEPAIELGSGFYASNLKSPKRYSIVAFDVNPYLKKNHFNVPSEESTHVSRIVGLENEKVEIKNGIVFINDKKQVPSFGLLFVCKMKSEDYEKYKDEFDLELTNPMQSVGKYAYVYIDGNEAAELKQKTNFEDFESPISGGGMYKISDFVKPEWTTSNFGPVVVPEDHFFMMSDNRDNALDSRFYGFINQDKIVGVKI